jgi:hypothetical protein
MRLSEAILLGSSIIKAKGGAIFYPDGSGCALGMGLAANGYTCNPFAGDGDALHLWPWLKQATVLPCCPTLLSEDGTTDVMSAIVHLFDFHVSEERDWTIEELCQWLASIEPPEPELQRSQPSPAQMPDRSVLHELKVT